MKTIRSIFASALAFGALGACALGLTLPVSEDSSAGGNAALAKSAGRDTALHVSAARQALVRFEAGAFADGIAAADVSKARLVVFIGSVSAPGALTLHRITQDWSEHGASVPAFDAVPLATIPESSVVAKKFVIVEVTEAVRAWLREPGSDFGFAIAARDGARVLLGAKEGSAVGHPAQLQIETRDAPPVAASMEGDDGATGTRAQVRAPVAGLLTNADIPANSLKGNRLRDGTVPGVKLVPNLTLAGTTTGIFSGTFTGPFTGSGAGLTELDASHLASGTVPDERLSANVVLRNAAAFSGTFTGNGAGLTALDASNLASGTVPDARLSANVVMRSAAAFTGSAEFNGAVDFSAATNKMAIRADLGAAAIAAPLSQFAPTTTAQLASVVRDTPAQFSGLQLWLDADSLGLSDGALVSSWTDSSGNSRNVTAAGGLRPTFKTAAIGGQAGVHFAGAQRMSSPAFATVDYNTAFTMLVVSRSDSSGGCDAYISTGTPVGGAYNLNHVRSGNADYWGPEIGPTPVENGLKPLISAIRVDGTSLAIRYNGRAAYPVAVEPITASLNIQGGALMVGGYPDGTFPWAGDICQVAIWNRALSTPELQALEKWAREKYTVGKEPLLIFDGDSITEGAGVTDTYPSKVLSSLGPNFYGACNYGIPGQRLVTMQTNSPAKFKTEIEASNGQEPIVICLAGSNDIAAAGGDSSAAVVEAAMLVYAKAVRALGVKLIVCTILPSTSAGAGADFVSRRTALNSWIRANWPAFADGMSDPGGNAIIGGDTASDNTAYFIDKTHLTDAGLAVLAGEVAPAIRRLRGLDVQTTGDFHTTLVQQTNSVVTLPNAAAWTVARTDAAQTFTGAQNFDTLNANNIFIAQTASASSFASTSGNPSLPSFYLGAGLGMYSSGAGKIDFVQGAARAGGFTSTGFEIAGTLAAAGGVSFGKTMTAAGATSVQTISKTSGSVRLAPGDTSKVLNNALVSPSSIVQATVCTHDATCKSVQAVKGAGTITFYPSAAPTEEVEIDFIVTN